MVVTCDCCCFKAAVAPVWKGRRRCMTTPTTQTPTMAPRTKQTPTAENNVLKTTLNTAGWNSNPDLPIFSSPVYCESDALYHSFTEAGLFLLITHTVLVTKISGSSPGVFSLSLHVNAIWLIPVRRLGSPSCKRPLLKCVCVQHCRGCDQTPVYSVDYYDATTGYGYQDDRLVYYRLVAELWRSLEQGNLCPVRHGR
uniref:Uncharacterized protein n=1 Tax=Timema bartmani TaxID=61472 RepID=A0A7R9FCV0_9NEOP|nr:unnamed protein product [Timema bartmani]